MRKFVSKIFTYPTSVRQEIDNYKTTGKNISTPQTIENVKSNKNEIVERDKQSLVTYREQVELSTLVENKKELLESLIVRCNNRLTTIINRGVGGIIDSKWEQLVKGYISEIRETVSVLAKLSGELKEDQTVIVNIVQGEMTKFLSSVYQIIKEVCPEKLDIIKVKLKEKFKEYVSQ